MVIRSIGVASVAKITGILYAAFGFLIGGLFSILSLVGAMAAVSQGGGDAMFGIFFGVGAVIILPIFYGVLGALAAAFGAVLYNLAAQFVGGVEIEVDGVPGSTAQP